MMNTDSNKLWQRTSLTIHTAILLFGVACSHSDPQDSMSATGTSSASAGANAQGKTNESAKKAPKEAEYVPSTVVPNENTLVFQPKSLTEQETKSCEGQPNAKACLQLKQIDLENKEQAAANELSILQGRTDGTSTEINILIGQNRLTDATSTDETAKQFWLRESISKNKALRSTKWIESAKTTISTRPHSPWATVRLQFNTLKPNTNYELVALDKSGAVLDHRKLTTLTPKNANLKFALISCIDDQYEKEQAQMWRDVWSQNPEAVFMIGDNVYADWRKGKRIGAYVEPKTLWDRYIETRQTLEVFKLRQLKPIFATWDDHDFGQNDGDQRYIYKNEAKEIFDAFYAQDAETKTFTRGPGVASRLSIANQNFIFLDDRSFRSPNKRSPICKTNKSSFCKESGTPEPEMEETHFGVDQEQWLAKQIKFTKGPLWLLNGVQFFGAYQPFESYEGNQPTSFKNFAAKLKSTKRTMIFASGDRHISEVMKIEPNQIGYTTYEVTSSAIHAKVFPSNWDEFPNSRQTKGAAGTFNYSIIDSRAASANALQVKIKAVGPDLKTLYTTDLNVKGP